MADVETKTVEVRTHYKLQTTFNVLRLFVELSCTDVDDFLLELIANVNGSFVSGFKTFLAAMSRLKAKINYSFRGNAKANPHWNNLN